MPSSPKPPLVLIVGPTGVGKTDVAIKLAERLDGEIVSADSRLFYRGMDIGTAKPTLQHRARVPHHLIDIAFPDEAITLAEFQARAGRAIAAIHGRHRLPLLVGGTGQYVRAVTEGWQPPRVRPAPRMRAELAALQQERGTDWLHARLASLDAAAARKIDHRNSRRTVRALEVIFATGRRFSEQRVARASPYKWLSLGLRRPRAELYARIDARIASMFQAGLLEEVRNLLARGYAAALPSMSAIGYRECIRVLSGDLTIDAAQAEIRRLTRVLVRRQANWFKESDPAIKWFLAGEPTAESMAALVRRWLLPDGD